jgi:hypothetical protein
VADAVFGRLAGTRVAKPSHRRFRLQGDLRLWSPGPDIAHCCSHSRTRRVRFGSIPSPPLSMGPSTFVILRPHRSDGSPPSGPPFFSVRSSAPTARISAPTVPDAKTRSGTHTHQAVCRTREHAVPGPHPEKEDHAGLAERSLARTRARHGGTEQVAWLLNERPPASRPPREPIPRVRDHRGWPPSTPLSHSEVVHCSRASDSLG